MDIRFWCIFRFCIIQFYIPQGKFKLLLMIIIYSIKGNPSAITIPKNKNHIPLFLKTAALIMPFVALWILIIFLRESTIS